MSDDTVSRSPELSEVIRTAFSYYLSDLHTAMPGTITEYDIPAQKAAIRPLLKRRVVDEDGNDFLEELPIIPDVPMMFPRAQDFFISLPVQPGDIVMMFFMERSIDNFLSSTNQNEPIDANEFRMHDMTDAVAFPGVYPFTRPIQDIESIGQNAIFGKDNGGLQIHVTPSGTMEVKVNKLSEENVALAGVLGNLWQAMRDAFDDHTHGETGGTTTKPNSGLPAFNSSGIVASSVLKVKDNS